MRILPLLAVAALCLLAASGAPAAEHSGRIVLEVRPAVGASAKDVDLWLPYPLSNRFQFISEMEVTGNFSTRAIYRDPGSGAVFLHAGWEGETMQPVLRIGFRVELESRETGALRDSGRPVPAPVRRQYLRSTPQVPAEEYAKLAGEITAGKTTILGKAEAVYDWTVENTFRDPEVQGCGLARPGRTLGQCRGGGKCADISAVFVTLARAAGVPARDVYGLRLSDPAKGEITSGFHCWAEFYLPGKGWVPADPADVRKMMLVHDLDLGDEATGDWRDFFWGGDDLFRLVLGKGNRGVVFTPRQAGDPVDYFMYPYAEVDGRKLDYFDPGGFAYSVRYIPDRP